MEIFFSWKMVYNFGSVLSLYACTLRHFSSVRLSVTPWTMARLLCPWNSPGKSTAISFSSDKVWSEWSESSEVAQSGLTLSDPMDCSPPGSPVHGIFQAILLEWIAIAFSVLSLRHLISSFGNSKQGDTKEQAKIRNREKKVGRMKTKIQTPDLSASLLVDLQI